MSVYFIQAEDGGPIKIGVSDDPTKRLANIQTGHHGTLRLLAVVDGAGVELESQLHTLFEAHRVRGEWFRPHVDIIDLTLAISNRHRQESHAEDLCAALELHGIEIDHLIILDALACIGLAIIDDPTGSASEAYFACLSNPS